MGGHLDGKGKAKHGLKTQGPQLHHPKGDLIQDAESRTQLNAPNFVGGFQCKFCIVPTSPSKDTFYGHKGDNVRV